RLVNGDDERSAKGVAPVGTIERQDGGVVAHLVADQLVAHGDFLSGRSISARLSGRARGMRKSASASVLPCVSARSDRLAPPASTSRSTKFRPSKFAAS